MRRRVIWAIVGLVGGFAALLGGRLGWGFVTNPPGGGAGWIGDGGAPSDPLEKRNYASKSASGGGGGAGGEQKYEKVGTLVARSKRFEDDEAATRAAIERHRGVIQRERRSGLPGARSLQLDVGVPPEDFDAALATLSRVGTPHSFDVVKTDKTNEYRALQAERASLEKTRAAMAELRGRGAGGGAELVELVDLEQRMLELERQIQELGVRLGEFDAEQSMCTVRVALHEARPHVAPSGPTWGRRLQVAFAWSVQAWARVVGAVLLGAIGVLVLVLLAKRVRAG
jgi:hypothetical protein